jgi:hypothetical protein
MTLVVNVVRYRVILFNLIKFFKITFAMKANSLKFNH